MKTKKVELIIKPSPTKKIQGRDLVASLGNSTKHLKKKELTLIFLKLLQTLRRREHFQFIL